MSKTLEELENDYWEVSENDTNLIRKCMRLRKKTITSFSIEELRILISQNIGLKYLIPKAIIILEADPIASGDFYEGDLLKAVINCCDVNKDTENELNTQLINFCKKAMFQLEANMLNDDTWENSSEDYGLTLQDSDASRKARIDELRESSPYIEFVEFSKQ